MTYSLDWLHKQRDRVIFYGNRFVKICRTVTVINPKIDGEI